ncbi:MAG: bifunctional hydroxymethylpyrimidine kinase/phosphomethylpyrimidine kinase [Candidatus Hydrogenedentota bacterium]
MATQLPRVLTIAGSDSGGGAGIQADLKTFAALGCYGMSAITAVTVQNTLGVFGVHTIPAETVAAQVDVVLDDLGADAIKTGMLANAAIIEAVADTLEKHPTPPLVLDPVMVAKSGDRLLEEAACDALIARLLPRALVITPNVPEAAVLAGMAIEDEHDLAEAAGRIHAHGPRYVLTKGGHLAGGEAVDFLFDGDKMLRLTAPRIDTKHTHGTGCTLASAIAAHLAHGDTVPDAVHRAKDYLTGAIRHHVPIGGGHGPLNHMWNRG